MTKTILVTGGAGYIGSHVNLALAENGFQPLVVDNFVNGHRDLVKTGILVECNINDRQKLSQIFEDYSILAVMHFAAFAYVGESVSDPAKYYTNNVVATINLLETMRRENVKNIIFSSTCATYGIPLEEKITEAHPQKPVNPYGRSKLMIEHILSDYEKAYGFNFVALRYFNAAGADPQLRVGERHLPETHLIPCILKAAHDPGQTFSIFGTDYSTPDGTCIRDFIHTTDLASAHILALRYLLEKGQSTAFNLGYGNGFSILDILNRARKITGEKIEIKYQNKRQGDPPRLVGNPAKAFSTLNWKPQYNDLDLILSTAWQWHVKDWK